MFQSIVVPLDGTPFSERALPCAERVAAVTGAALHLVRVRAAQAPAAAATAYPHEGTGLPPAAEAPSAIEATEYLDRIATEVASHVDCTVDAAVLDGEVSPCLAGYIDEVDADGVILATRAPGALGRVLVGSFADQIIRTVEIPVLAVPPDGEGEGPPTLDPVLVALDGSEEGEAVLSMATRLAVALEARVTLIHVIPSEGPSGGMPFHLQGQWEVEMDEGERYLERIRDRMRRRGLRVDTVVMAHPSPARAICEVADEIGAGLVAMGTHGRGGLSRALLGSVVRDVLTRGHRPVMVRRVH